MVTLNGIRSALDEINKLQFLLAEDIASLESGNHALAKSAIEEKRNAAKMLESTRQQLDGLSASVDRWTHKVLAVKEAK